MRQRWSDRGKRIRRNDREKTWMKKTVSRKTEMQEVTQRVRKKARKGRGKRKEREDISVILSGRGFPRVRRCLVSRPTFRAFVILLVLLPVPFSLFEHWPYDGMMRLCHTDVNLILPMRVRVLFLLYREEHYFYATLNAKYIRLCFRALFLFEKMLSSIFFSYKIKIR